MSKLGAFFIVCTMVLGGSSSACTWCSDLQKAPDIALPAIVPDSVMGASEDTHKTVAIGPVPNASDIERMHLESTLGKSPFYTLYLKNYYPTAKRILFEYFSRMCPQAIHASLKTVVDLLANHAWFYFKNSPVKFYSAEYWECMVEQCSIIDEFLLYARVRLKDGSVCSKRLTYDQLVSKEDPYVRLIEYWKNQHMDSAYYFYGFYFDYTNKLFNEGIRFLDLDKAKKYKRDMQRIFRKLKGWRYEKRYEQVISRSGDLINIVRQRLGITKKEVDDDMF